MEQVQCVGYTTHPNNGFVSLAIDNRYEGAQWNIWPKKDPHTGFSEYSIISGSFDSGHYGALTQSDNAKDVKCIPGNSGSSWSLASL